MAPFLEAAGYSVDTATPNPFNFFYGAINSGYAEESPVISTYGTASLAPALAPEPATWALMLAGFVGLG